jgi:hypothetical protein
MDTTWFDCHLLGCPNVKHGTCGTCRLASSNGDLGIERYMLCVCHPLVLLPIKCFLISFGLVFTDTTSQTLFLAYIPSLGRNMTRTRASRQKYENGTISFAEYELAESLEKNQIGNVVEVNRNVGCLVVLLLSLSLLIPLSKHPLVDNYTIVLCNAYWILIGIWWCNCISWFHCNIYSLLLFLVVFQQPRPRPTVPGNPLTLGVRQESP